MIEPSLLLTIMGGDESSCVWGVTGIGNGNSRKMVTTVVCLNGLIALGLLYAAWRIWCLQYMLARVTIILTHAERSTHRLLSQAPEAIRAGQLGIYELRRELAQLDGKLSQMQQVLAVLGFAVSWLRRSPTRSLRRSR